MPNIAIVVEVHPPATESSDWVYHAYGADIQTISEGNTLVVPKGTKPQIMVALVPGGELDDSCVFADPPLTFTNEENQEISTPDWFKNLQVLDPSIIQFTDDNESHPLPTVCFIKVRMRYNEGAPVTSPDPTIVNEGTGMVLESPAKAPQVQTQSA